jgi:hypothetical protein
MVRRAAAVLALLLVVPVLAVAKAPGTGGTASTLPPVRSLGPDDLKALSFDDMVRNGGKYVKDMEKSVQGVLDSMALAVKANDFARINCISEALTVMKGLMRLSGQNELALREAVVGRNRAGAEHEYVKLHLASQRTAQMQAQASSCGGPGADTIFTGSPVVQQDFDKDLPMDEMKKVLWNWFVNLEPPPSASPFY